MAKNPSAMSDKVTDEQLDRVLSRVAMNGEEVDALVYEVVDKYCAPVDELIDRIQAILDNSKEFTDRQLETYIMQIPGKLYYVNTATEALGIRDDVARLLYKEAFNKHRREAQGTVSDKDQEAELLSNPEALASVIYNRAFRMVKAKMDMAFEMLQSLKKVISHRMVEKEVSQVDTGRTPV